MFEIEQQKIKDFRKQRSMLNIVFAALKLLIAYVLITYVDYGLFIVIGYIMYALESAAGLQFVSSQEIDLQLNILHQKISELESKEN